MNEVWKILYKYGISPNELYLLDSIRNNISCYFINVNTELHKLKIKELIKDGDKGTYILSVKANNLLDKVELLMTEQQEKVKKKVIGDDYEEKVKKYRELWPKGKLPTGKPARSPVSLLIDDFKWFFENFDYDWDLIFKATNLYLDEKEAENWNYTRTSKYFIRKQNNDKSWNSDLAEYCQLIEDGDDLNNQDHFKEKIF